MINKIQTGPQTVLDPKPRRDFFENLYTPPFSFLPVIVWLYFLFRLLIHPETAVLMGRLPDPDDYMYLMDVSSWLDHGSGDSHFLPRLDPPYGTILHFSRLAELPLAAIARFFGLFLGPPQQAIWCAAVILPPLYFGLFLCVLAWSLRPLVGRRRANLGSLVSLLFFSLVLTLFQPGRIDHHGAQILLMCGTLGAVTRWMKDGKAKYLAITAILFALSLGIGEETLPWIALMSATVLVAATWQGNPATSALKVFAGTLLLSTVIVLGLSRAPAAWLVADTTSFSIVYAAFLAGIALLSGILALLGKNSRITRISIIVPIGLFLGLGYLRLFPQMLAGPYGGVDHAQTDEILPVITEAMPWLKLSKDPIEFFSLLAWPLLGFLVSVWQSRRNSKMRAFWILLTVLLLISVTLGVFYQGRTLWFAALFAIFPLTWFFVTEQKMLARCFLKNPRRTFAAIMGLAALAYGVFILPGLMPERKNHLVPTTSSLAEETLLQTRRHKTCNLQPVAALLNAPNAFGRQPLRIMAPLEDGAELLFMTQASRHSVFAAPYHDVHYGNRLARLFFAAEQPETAEKIAREQKIDIVVVCGSFPPLYLLQRDTSAPPAQPRNVFFLDLVRGRLPPWLEELKLPVPTGYRVFAVKFDKAG